MARLSNIAIRQLKLRKELWPEVGDDDLWLRKKSDGFTTIPRTMPIIMSIADDLAGERVSSTYLEIWCRAYDECFVVLSKSRELAFHSGFSGQRAERAWRSRVRKLAALGFIDVKEGPSGPESYALIRNPYKVIKGHKEKCTSGLAQDKYNALFARAVEIGAKDMDQPAAKSPATKE
jgi:hypothetical protein